MPDEFKDTDEKIAALKENINVQREKLRGLQPHLQSLKCMLPHSEIIQKIKTVENLLEDNKAKLANFGKKGGELSKEQMNQLKKKIQKTKNDKTTISKTVTRIFRCRFSKF